MVENWKHLKDTLVFSLFLVCLDRNRVLLTSGDLLLKISLVVSQLSVNASHALCVRYISTTTDLQPVIYWATSHCKQDSVCHSGSTI